LFALQTAATRFSCAPPNDNWRFQMADKLEAEFGGKSKYEVAHTLAFNIITKIEKKALSDVTRNHYLQTVSDSIHALEGYNFD
jgi:hypothetical protein